MNNYNEVKKSFGTQAEKFASYHMSKAEYTDYLIRSIQAKGNEHALEVAAGTCICGRAVAPYVKDITCLDLTEAMLEQGKKLAKQEGIQNISFVSGNAECLPFEDETFDLVITRLSLHHFVEPEKPFREMQRVLKKGGKLVIWDMVATTEELRETNDAIETMRDNSHTRILSREEFEALFEDAFELQLEETTLVPVNLQSWMDLTSTPEDIQKDIIDKISNDLEKGVIFFANIIDQSKIIYIAKNKNTNANCGFLVKEAAIKSGGNGGGRADFAQSGGKDVNKVDEVLDFIREQLQ